MLSRVCKENSQKELSPCSQLKNKRRLERRSNKNPHQIDEKRSNVDFFLAQIDGKDPIPKENKICLKQKSEN